MALNLDDELVKGLNEQQARVVVSRHARMLVIAGAGAGKTSVLTRRVVGLIARGVPPEMILAVTFTRKAASEMEERVQALLAEHLPRAAMPEIRTLHAWGARMIRRYADHFGLTPDFTIYDEVDTEDIVRMVARERGHKSWEKGKVSALLKEAPIRMEYARRLNEGNAIDFDMIEAYTLRLLQEHEETRRRWTGFYRHVLVDEYQDTNLAQVAIVQGIAPDNLFVVGDARQCQPAGTMVATPSGARPIETLVTGDKVTGWSRRSAFVGGERRVEVACRPYTGVLYTIKTESGRVTTCTDTHRWVARWSDEARALTAVYLMRRSFSYDTAYRVGWCKVLDESGGRRLHHYKLRARLEDADAIWLVRLEPDRGRASIWESIISPRYALPTAMFNPVAGNVYYTRDSLDYLWQRTAAMSQKGAALLASDYALSLDHPMWTPSVPGGRQTLFECVGANLRIGMAVPVWDGARGYVWETIREVSRRFVERESVYSLDVDIDHAYVADGICTLNSIYRFRGAEVKTIVQHARDAAFEVHELTANYRSVPDIVAYGNGCVDGDWASMVSARARPIVHWSDWAQQPDVHVVCGRYTQPAWVKTGKVPHARVYEGTPFAPFVGEPEGDTVLYTFDEAHATCEACIAKMESPPRAVQGFTYRAEPPLVLGLIREERESFQTRWSDIAVLARNWAALEAIRDGLVRAGIPTNFCGADEDPWATADGRAIARAVQLAHNPNDSNLALLLSEWGAMGRRRFSDYGMLRATALRARQSVLRTMAELDTEWGGVVRAFDTRTAGPWTPADHVRAFLEPLQVEETYATRGLTSRLETIRALLAELQERHPTLEAFVEWWTGKTLADRLRESRDAVRLITIHGAKGLEWPVVILADFRAGALPSDRVRATDEDRAEDLRVAYVGITRARDRLYLTCPRRHKIPWGFGTEPSTPSPYLVRPGGPGLPLAAWTPSSWGTDLTTLVSE